MLCITAPGKHYRNEHGVSTAMTVYGLAQTAYVIYPLHYNMNRSVI